MAVKGKFQIDCPSCGKTFDADIWTVVRGDRDFKLKEKIIEGEFDLFMCPSCRKVFAKEETFIYHDPKMELFAFVLPAGFLPEKEKWLKKMANDYKTIEKSISNEKSFPVEPMILFGIDMLRSLLIRDRDIEEETDVVKFIAGDLGLSFVGIKADFARNNDFIFAYPYSGLKIDRDSMLKGVKKIHAKNKSLPRLNKFLKFLNSPESGSLDFIENENISA